MFPINNGLIQGDVLLRLLFNIAVEYAISGVQVNQNGLKLNGTCQLLVYADGINIMDGSEQNIGTLVAASKETGLEVNTFTLSTWSCFEIRKQDVVII